MQRLRNKIIGMAAVFVLAMGSAYSAPKTILVLGDSLSAEYGLQRGSGWVALLQQRLNNEKIAATVINASISGDTTSGGKARLVALLQRHQPDILVLELGANDGLRGLALLETKRNLATMLDAAPKARALLIGMQIPPNYGSVYTREFAALFKDLAKTRKTALVPFLLEGVTQFQADRLHPTEQAQTIMLDNVWPHLLPLLKKQ